MGDRVLCQRECSNKQIWMWTSGCPKTCWRAHRGMRRQGVKHFLHNRPIVMEFHRSPSVEWTVEWPVLLDAMTLMWRHSNRIIDCIAVRYKAPEWKCHFNKITVTWLCRKFCSRHCADRGGQKYLVNFLFWLYVSNPLIDIDIWQGSSQLCCGDACQIWTWIL